MLLFSQIISEIIWTNHLVAPSLLPHPSATYEMAYFSC